MDSKVMLSRISIKARITNLKSDLYFFMLIHHDLVQEANQHLFLSQDFIQILVLQHIILKESTD